jgi:hypothetical protein
MCGGTGTGPACYSTGGVFYSLNVGLKPFVSLLPYLGKVGKTIEFLGQGFKRTKNVSFNGTAASFKVVSDTYLTATVPNGATTGFVIVTTAKGKLKSNKKFRVIRNALLALVLLTGHSTSLRRLFAPNAQRRAAAREF